MARTSEEQDFIVISQQKYKVRNASVTTKSLKLDPDNPRIRYLADLKGIQTTTPEKIVDLLLEDDDIKELYTDIKRQGGLQEPIVVNKDLTIIEGNSRAACYRMLLGKDKAGDWKNIRCRIFTEQLPPDKVAALQARYHVRGKNEWRAFAQAEHYYRMHTKFGKSPREIHEETNMHEKTISNMIAAYKMMRIHLLDGKKGAASHGLIKKYSYFYEMQKTGDSTVAQFRKSPRNQKLFAQWVDTGKFERGADVRKLSTILKSPDARAKFESSGISAARPVIGKLNPAAESALYRKIEKLNQELRQNFSAETKGMNSVPARRHLIEALSKTLIKMLEMPRD